MLELPTFNKKDLPTLLSLDKTLRKPKKINSHHKRT
jgi:hypothetical protein